MNTEKRTPSNESQKKFSIMPQAVTRARISTTARVVYAEIASYYWGDASEIYPAYSTIAAAVGLSRITVIRAVKELVAAGIIEKQNRMRDDRGGYGSNIYFIRDIKNDTSRGIKNDTSRGIKNDTMNNTKQIKNNINLKINNTRARTRAKNAAAAAQRAAELERLKTSDKQVLEIAATSKKASWFDLVRISSRYFLRPKSPKWNLYVTSNEFEELRALIAQTAGSCQALKYGQHNITEEVLQ